MRIYYCSKWPSSNYNNDDFNNYHYYDHYYYYFHNEAAAASLALINWLVVSQLAIVRFSSKSGDINARGGTTEGVPYFSTFAPVRGQIIDTLAKWGKQFSVSFSFRLNTAPSKAHHSLIHFTSGGNCCGYGQRAPAVWITRGRIGGEKPLILYQTNRELISPGNIHSINRLCLKSVLVRQA